MYIVVDDRQSVTGSYASGFSREGVASIGFGASDFLDWLQVCGAGDLNATEAFLIGEGDGQIGLPAAIRRRCTAPIIALRSLRSLKSTLELFDAGVDDVVNVPVHVRELLARVAAIRRRSSSPNIRQNTNRALQVFFDGRDPEVEGSALTLPRRELRILEYMVAHQGRWITKTQIFNAIYGIFDSSFDESVIESHVSKLRKKLKARLGYDPILSKRFVGYRLDAGLHTDVATDGDDDVMGVSMLSKSLAPRREPTVSAWTGVPSAAPSRALLDGHAIRLINSRSGGQIANSP